MIRRGGLALAVALSVAGCGGDGSEGPVTVERICGTDGPFVRLYQKLFECNPLFATINGREPTAEEISATCREGIAPYVEDGTVVIDPGGDLAGCTALIEQATCDSFRGDLFADCDSLLDGTVAIGFDCENDAQCEGDAWCDLGGLGCGTCVPRQADGEACDTDVECTARNCSSFGQCAPLGVVGDPCLETIDCAEGFSCDAAVSQCVAEPAWTVGTPCASGGDCDFGQSNLYCNESAGACAAFLEVGDPCSPEGTGGVCRIFEYQTCRMDESAGTYQCAAPTLVDEGEECGVAQGLRCVPGLVCAVQPGGLASACVDPPGEHESCGTAGVECDFFLTCNDASDTCEYSTYTAMCPAP
jgi:hypothetical protein